VVFIADFFCILEDKLSGIYKFGIDSKLAVLFSVSLGSCSDIDPDCLDVRLKQEK